LRLIHRYHQTGQGEILDAFKGYPDTFELSFKYAITHMYSIPNPPFIQAALPNIVPEHRTWLTVRDDDIYSFRWGDSEYARGKFVAGLKCAFGQGKLVFPGSLQPLAREKAFHAFLRPLFRQDWVVYAKRPSGGPEHVLHYLARYTHRVAISNHRLLSVADGNVTFRWKDYAHGSKQRKMTITAEEFLRRFMLHVLPRRFVRIRFSGFLANRRRRQLLPLCQQLLESSPQPRSETLGSSETKPTPAWLCPCCGGAMVVIEKLTAQQIRRRSVDRKPRVDSS
jgi:hypothetical protein